MFKLKSIITLTLLFLLTACGTPQPAPTASQAKPMPTPTNEPAAAVVTETLTLMTHDSFAVSDAVIQAFEQANQVKVTILPSGDAGAAVNQAILAKDAPLADVFFGVDNSFLSRALDNGIFESYNSPMLAQVAAEFKLDPENRMLPVDYGDVCLNYDKDWFAQKKLTPPATLDDLLKPEYKGLLVVENPATSSPGLAFVLATIVKFGDPGYLDYWQKLVTQDVLVVDGWTEAYTAEFTRYKGTRPIVVSYASSPPAEVYYAEKPLSDTPIAAVLGEGTCFRQIEFMGILAGTKKRALAEKLIDFMLDVKFQEDIPLSMFVFPVNPQAKLPELFQKYAKIAAKPATLPPADIAAKRDTWLKAWTETVLR